MSEVNYAFWVHLETLSRQKIVKVEELELLLETLLKNFPSMLKKKEDTCPELKEYKELTQVVEQMNNYEEEDLVNENHLPEYLENKILTIQAHISDTPFAYETSDLQELQSEYNQYDIGGVTFFGCTAKKIL